MFLVAVSTVQFVFRKYEMWLLEEIDVNPEVEQFLWFSHKDPILEVEFYITLQWKITAMKDDEASILLSELGIQCGVSLMKSLRVAFDFERNVDTANRYWADVDLLQYPSLLRNLFGSRQKQVPVVLNVPLLGRDRHSFPISSSFVGIKTHRILSSLANARVQKVRTNDQPSPPFACFAVDTNHVCRISIQPIPNVQTAVANQVEWRCVMVVERIVCHSSMKTSGIVRPFGAEIVDAEMIGMLGIQVALDFSHRISVQPFNVFGRESHGNNLSRDVSEIKVKSTRLQSNLLL